MDVKQRHLDLFEVSFCVQKGENVSNIAKQLRNLDVSKLKMKNGNTVAEELRKHARILADCIQKALDEVYESYSPKVYRRSFGLYDSVYIDDVIKVEVTAKGANLSIRVSFDEGSHYENFYGEESNVAILLHEGWSWKNSSVDIPYLSSREGTHFIERGIEEYKRSVKKPFAVRFTINDDVRMF